MVPTSISGPRRISTTTERDLARFDTEETSDALFDLICTVNHIWDWVKNDESIPEAVRRSKPSGETNHDIGLVKLLCDRAKHFKKRDALSTDTVDTGALGGRAALGDPVTPFTLMGGPVYVVDDDGTKRSVRDVVVSALAMWQGFLTSNGLL